MSITDRDRKILAAIAVIAVIAGYWFLLLSPKRTEVAKVEEEITAQQSQRDAALQQAQAAKAAKASFATDYAEIVRLGKAIPGTVDMPSLLVQLDQAAKGTDIEFDKITAGPRVAAAPPAPPATPPAGAEGAAAPGGEQAGSAPGQTAEGAAENAEQLDTDTSQNARDGSVPVGGGTGGQAPAAAGASGVAGLDTVPLDFTFKGDFFDLVDFFHRLKRFVRVRDGGVVVRGRLMTIDSFNFSTDESGGGLTAAVKATVYLAPKSQGTTAGATPSGPAPQADATTASAPTPPTAAAQP